MRLRNCERPAIQNRSSIKKKLMIYTKSCSLTVRSDKYPNGQSRQRIIEEISHREYVFSRPLKNEIKHRETAWSHVYWELVMPIEKIGTLRARLIGVDRNDLSKVFVQLTLEFLSEQKFEAYDTSGAVVAGDKNKEVLVRDIWVFEKSLFHQGAYWRLCGRIKV